MNGAVVITGRREPRREAPGLLRVASLALVVVGGDQERAAELVLARLAQDGDFRARVARRAVEEADAIIEGVRSWYGVRRKT